MLNSSSEAQDKVIGSFGGEQAGQFIPRFDFDDPAAIPGFNGLIRVKDGGKKPVQRLGSHHAEIGAYLIAFPAQTMTGDAQRLKQLVSMCRVAR